MSTLATHESKAIPALAPGIAQKINALHDTARHLEKEPREKLHEAVCAAWQARRLLLDARASIVHHGGRGAWTPWVRTMFKGSIRTAQRYMELARELPEFTLATPNAMSLRRLYFRLGIATEPKQASGIRCAARLPAHIRLANKLVRELRKSRWRINSRDLAALYSDLRRLFETQHSE